MSILNVDKIQPIGSGSTVTVNATDTILTNAQAGVITATRFDGIISATTDDWITHQSDSNTRIGFPAADTFSVETAGQQNVQVTADRTRLTSPSGTNTTVRLQHQGNSGYGDIILDRTVNAFIIDNDPNNAGSNGTYFSVKNKGTENLRITHDGKVGINQVSPDGMLHIWSATAGSVSADADADELVLENSGNVGLSLLTAGTGESSIYFGNPGTNGQKDAWIKYYHESHSTTANRRGLSFKTGGGSEKMKLDHAGRLLIGRESAYAHVDADNLIVGNEATNEHQGITILTHSGKYGGIYFGDGHNPNGHNRCKIIYDHPNDQFRIGTAGNSNQFYLDASGHMGLGISPSDVDSIGRALNIASSTGGAIYLQDTDAPTTKFAAISYNGGTAALQIHAHHSASYIDLGTNGTERLRITSAGRVALGGETSPSHTFHVRGEAENCIRWIRTGSSVGGSLYSDGGGSGIVGGDGVLDNTGIYLVTDTRIDFRVNGSERLRLGTNSNNSSIGSFGTGSSHLNNCTTPDRASFKVGGRLHVEGAFGHNAMTGLYYNCYSGGNDLFYSGTYTPSGGDGRAAAITMRYGGVAVMVDNSSTAYSPTNQITTMQTALNVDREGRVTKPLQPSFHARRTNSANSTSNPLVFDSVHHNNGSHYKSSGTDQGKFVAPVAGVYLFYWCAIKTNNGSVCRLYIKKNGSNIYSSMHLRLQEDGTYSNGSMQAILNLSSGDKVHISLEAGSIHGNEYTHFGGYLIG